MTFLGNPRAGQVLVSVSVLSTIRPKIDLRKFTSTKYMISKKQTPVVDIPTFTTSYLQFLVSRLIYKHLSNGINDR